MKAAWVVSEGRKSVAVSCNRTISSAHERNWKVVVSVYTKGKQPRVKAPVD